MAITAKPSFIPTLNKKTVVAPVAPVAAVVEEPVIEEEGEVMTEEVAVEEAPVKKTRKKSEGERKTPNRQMNKEDIAFVVANVKTMSYTEMATERGLTKHQVNRVLMSVKKDLVESAKDNPEALAKVKAYIEANLSRPADTRPGAGGGAGRSSAVKDSIDDIVGNILNGIK